MTSDETKNYIGQRLQELGLALHLDDRGYEKIHRFTNGTESGINQLCFKLVSLTAENDQREVTNERVSKAIEELARIDEMMRRAGKADVPEASDEVDRNSIDQLAAVLEANAAVISAAAQSHTVPKPARASRGAAKRATERRPKILVVNEAKTTRAIIVNALSGEFDCIETEDVDDAWHRLAHQTNIDLVITDVRAHDRAQYDLIGRIRSAGAPGHLIGVPIIAMAATEDASAKQRALVAGANDVIAMNTSAGELKARVQARYRASRIEPTYGAGKTQTATRPVERKNGNGNGRSAARPAAAAASARTLDGPAMDPKRIGAVQRPFLNAPDPSRGRAAAPRAGFLRWLYQVSATTTVTLSATVLVVVLLALIMYNNRVGLNDRGTPTAVTSAKTESAEPSKPQADEAAPVPPTTPAAETPPSEPVRPTPLDSERIAAVKPRVGDESTRSRDVPKNPSADISRSRAENAASGADVGSVKSEARPSLAPAERSTAVAPPPAVSVPAPTSTPAPSDVAANRAAASENGTTAAMKAAPERVSREDLATLLRRFAFVYEAGDIEQFMNLFASNARTNDRMNRDGIRQDYESLFRTTDLRQFKLSHINWEVDNNQAHGWGNFEVTVRRAGEQELHNYSGSLTLYVERIDGRLRIVRLYHGQRRAGP